MIGCLMIKTRKMHHKHHKQTTTIRKMTSPSECFPTWFLLILDGLSFFGCFHYVCGNICDLSSSQVCAWWTWKTPVSATASEQGAEGETLDQSLELQIKWSIFIQFVPKRICWISISGAGDWWHENARPEKPEQYIYIYVHCHTYLHPHLRAGCEFDWLGWMRRCWRDGGLSRRRHVCHLLICFDLAETTYNDQVGKIHYIPFNFNHVILAQDKVTLFIVRFETGGHWWRGWLNLMQGLLLEALFVVR